MSDIKTIVQTKTIGVSIIPFDINFLVPIANIYSHCHFILPFKSFVNHINLKSSLQRLNFESFIKINPINGN